MSKKKGDAVSGGRSLVVLSASLVLVYTIFFGYQQPIEPLLEASAQVFEGQYEPAPWAEKEAAIRSAVSETAVAKTQEDSVEIAQVQIAESLQKQPVTVLQPTTQPVKKRPTTTDGKQFFSFHELFVEESEPQLSEPAVVERIPLANTFERVGDLRSIVDFGLSDEVEYILKTVQNTHYVYLGKRETVAIPAILQLGGTVVEIEGKNAINQHSLFGDRVMKISTERYDTRFKKVIMVVFFEQTRDAWFVQVDQDYYDAHADDIRAVFDEWYDW